MVKEIKQTGPAAAGALLDLLRNSWFLIVFVGTAIYWAAKHDSSLTDIQKLEARAAALESRVATLESGLGQLQLKLDVIKEDITMIKSAVIK
ncbi:MAG: hypothetical protein LBK26_00405 [Rickettsiales bacterium]|jgi:hypothetical protein|nr:hypothetical protein [Rickettsiales bacterium]